MLPSAKFIVGFVLVLVVTYFALYNMQNVTIQYYFGPRRITVPLSFAIFGAFLVGFLVSWVIRMVKQIGLARQVRRHRKSEERMSEEIRSLRAQIEQVSRSALEAVLARHGGEGSPEKDEADARS